MSQDSNNLRPQEEALAAMLIIAGLGVGSLFIVAKTVGKRFVRYGSTPGEDEAGSVNDEDGRPPKPFEENNGTEDGRDGTTSIQGDSLSAEESSVEDNKNSKSEPTGPETQKPQLLPTQRDRDRDREEALTAMRLWEEATRTRIKRQLTRRLQRLPSPEQPDFNPDEMYGGIQAWHEATFSRFQQEKARRLRRLSSLERR